MNQFMTSSNAYATGKLGERDWNPIDMAEMKTFFAIIMYLGMNRSSSREYAWENELFGSRFCMDGMSKTRFERILSMLHWQNTYGISDADRRERNRVDPFWTIETLMQKLTSNHKKYYQFGQHCDIDEAAIAWSGNHSWINQTHFISKLL